MITNSSYSKNIEKLPFAIDILHIPSKYDNNRSVLCILYTLQLSLDHFISIDFYRIIFVFFSLFNLNKCCNASGGMCVSMAMLRDNIRSENLSHRNKSSVNISYCSQLLPCCFYSLLWKKKNEKKIYWYVSCFILSHTQ